MNLKNNRIRYSGFTMIEVMAAMLILAMVCIAYSQNQVGAIRLVQATRYRDTAIMLAKQRMAEIDFLIQTKGLEAIKDSEQGEFDQEKFKSYTWRSVKKMIAPPDFSALMAMGSGESEIGEDESSAPQQTGSFDGPMKAITDVWGKSINELRLDIVWKEGEKEEEKSYTLVTHYLVKNAQQQVQGLIGAMTGGQAGAQPQPR